MNDTTKVLSHHGVLGMKWGVRRYQNKDGSLTSKGRQHYQQRADKLESTIKRSRGDIAYLNEQWTREGWSKKDISLGLEEYKVALQRNRSKLESIKEYLSSNQGPVNKAKIEKLQAKIESSKQEGLAFAQKKRDAIQKDIDSFSPFVQTGIFDNRGRIMLSPEDVKKSIEALEKVKNKI